MHKIVLAIGVLFFSLHGVVAQVATKPASVNTATVAVGDARRFYQTGLDLMEAGQLSQAAGNFRQALQLDPEYAEAYAALGRTYFKMREWQQASDNLKRAVMLNHKQRTAAPIEPVQAASVVATHAPLNISWRRMNAEIVSSNETTASAINLRNLLPLIPEPPPVAVNENKTIPVARTEETPLTKIYRVGPNDVLDIRLNDSSAQQSTLYTVTAAGLLEHPLLSETDASGWSHRRRNRLTDRGRLATPRDHRKRESRRWRTRLCKSHSSCQWSRERFRN